jgi:hypothetical protein
MRLLWAMQMQPTQQQQQHHQQQQQQLTTTTNNNDDDDDNDDDSGKRSGGKTKATQASDAIDLHAMVRIVCSKMADVVFAQFLRFVL